jgi:hypothetical protein
VQAHASSPQPGGRPGPAVAPPWTPTWKLYTGIVVAGLGAASLGAAGYFGNEVESIQRDYDDLYDELNSPPIENEADKRAQYESLQDDGQAAQLRHFVTLGAGVGLVAVGGGLILWDLFSGPAPRVEPDPPGTTMVHNLDVGVAPAAAGGAQVVISGAW